MGVFDHFPYTNFHELNLMWILQALKEIQTTTEQFVAINSLKYADPIQWNIVQQYEKNTIVIDPLTGTAYISVQAVPSGVALINTDYWTVVFDLGSFVTRAAKNFTDRWESQWTVTATFPSNIGDWLVWNDTLYMVISNIVAGDRYVIDSNIRHFTMEELYGEITNMISEISDLIGDLDSLTTSDKNNLVDAINSLVTRIINGYDNYAGRYIPADETTNIFNIAINPNEWFIWGDYLYEATTTINPGDTLEIGTNIQRVYLQGVRDTIESEIGDRATLVTTDKSNLVAAINENRDLIDVLNGTVGDLYATSPFVEYSSYLTVGTNGRFQTITDAYDHALTYADSSHKVAILIFSGTYREQITNINANYIDFIGIGNVTWIYAADYPDSPLYIGGSSTISNINFAQDKIGSQAYAVHIEGGTAGTLKFINCSFTSVSAQAVGVGFTGDRTVEFLNCRFISYVQECLYVHNRADADGDNQNLILNGCVFNTISPTSPVFIAEDARYRAGTTGSVTNSILNITANSCVGNRNSVLYQEVTAGVVSYSLPFIPQAGAPYYKFVILIGEGINGLTGLTPIDYAFKIGSSGMFDPSCNMVIPCKNAEKYNVTAFVQLGGIGGADITSNITVTVADGHVQLHSDDATHATLQMYAELTFTLKP